MSSRRLDWLLPAWLEDANAFDQSMDEGMSTVAYTILFNVVIFLFFIVFFSIYRRYDPKAFTPKVDMFPKSLPRIPNDSYFGWIRDLYNITEEQILSTGNGCYDQLFLLRFYKFSFKVFLYFSIYAWLVILPVNRTGRADTSLNSFEVWSMTNIPQQSARCWYHFIGICVLSGMIVYFLEQEFVVYAKYRHDYLRQRHARLRTVLVEGIPHKMRTNVTLATYFEALYPNAVLSVRVAQNLSYLDKLVAERLGIVGRLEKYYYLAHIGNTRHTVRPRNMMQDVDAIEYYSKELERLNEAIAKEQDIARRIAQREDRLSGSTAFGVIEEFLQVTEIGSLRKMLKRKSGRSDKWMNPSKASDSSYIDLNSYQHADSLDIPEPESPSEMKKFDRISTRVPFTVVKLSWSEWLKTLWSSPTVTEFWRVFKDGRTGEVHDPNGETVALISPPEERRMFLSKAFVTFKTFTAATIARQVIHMQLAKHLAVSEAPETTDIVWSNIYATRTGVFYRRIFVEIAVILLNLVWVAPVTLVSFVVSENALRETFPFIDRICEMSAWYESGVQLVQPGAIVALMYLLPPILQNLGVMEGYVSISDIQFRTFDRYFLFQIINVFLVTTVAGSVINCVREIYGDPSSAFKLLGSSLPKMGGFFTNYVFMKAFTGLGMEIVRLPAAVIAVLKFLFTPNLTPRERRSTPFFGSLRTMDNPGWFGYAKIYAQDMLQVVVCATYANITPLILVPGLCYFGLAHFIYKHQMLYVYEPIYETGGKFWPIIARCFVVALLLAQATLIGLFFLKEAYMQAYALSAVFGATFLYYWNVSRTYVPLAKQLPFDMAASMDLDLEKNPDELLLGAEEYVQPSLRAKYVEPELEFPLEDKSFDRDLVRV